VILQAFCDESASEQDGKVLVVAGYIQKAVVWSFFSDAWKAVLDTPPSIEYFHMAEAENLNGQFRGWSAEQRDAKVATLADIIVGFRPWSISCSISREQHERIVRPVSPYDLRKPFVECFLAIVVKLAQWHEAMGETLPVDIVFDECGITPPESAFFYNGAKNALSPEARELLGGPPIFRDDKKILPLQAADMLAWHLRRQIEIRNAAEIRPVWEKLSVLLHAEAAIDARSLNGMARDMAPVPGRVFTMRKRDSIKKLLR
jgi:hypothetical protein